MALETGVVFDDVVDEGTGDADLFSRAWWVVIACNARVPITVKREFGIVGLVPLRL